VPPVTPSRGTPSTLQLVLTTDDGGDPFEQLMTVYYWSRLNHAIPIATVFDPTRRYVEDIRTDDPQRAQFLAAYMLESFAPLY
jgi:hypothetical protein